MSDYIENREELQKEIEKLRNEVKLLTRVEKALKESEVRFSHLSEAAFEGIAIQSGGEIMLVNKKLTELFGYSEHEMIGKKSIELVVPEQRKTVLREIDRHNEQAYEATCIRKDGTTFQAEIIGKNIPYEGKLARVFVIRDISKSKQIERRLMKSEERFKTLFQESQDAIYISTVDGKLEEVNPAAVEMFGFTRDELIGLDVRKVYKNARERELLTGELLKYGRINNFDVQLRRKDGTLIDTLISANVRRNIDNEIIGYQGIIKDITARKKNQELMREKEVAESSRDMKAQFLANMSHEIRTPMNAIFGLTNLLLQSHPTEEQLKYIQSIKTSSEHLIILINDILDFSKIEAGKLDLEETNFNLQDLADQMVETFQPKAFQKGLKFDVKIDPQIKHELIGDPTRLNQILLNLMSNAIKFTKKGGVKLDISVIRQNPGQVVIRAVVSDTGIGIPPDKVDYIFESFTQASTKTTRTHGGTGLGLAITRRLLELQGGKLFISSEEGKGSEFSFNLTYKKGRALDAIDDEEAEQKVVIRKLPAMNVLIVEDHKVNQMVAKETLKKWGKDLEIDVADNGKIASEILSEKDYDLILMDIQMPEMDGYETTAFIREQLPSPKNEVPILAMTAYATTGEAEKCIEAGMNDYISKPFDPDTFYAKIAKLIDFEVAEQKVNVLDNGSSGPAIQLDYLTSITGENTDLQRTMIQMLIDEIPDEIDQLKKAYKNNDWKALGAKAHKYKSSAGYMGNNELLEIVKKVEKCAKEEKNLDEVQDLLEKIESMSLGAITELKQVMETL